MRLAPRAVLTRPSATVTPSLKELCVNYIIKNRESVGRLGILPLELRELVEK